MLAVIEIGGKQYNVTLGTKFQTEKIDLPEGKTFEIEKVLLVSEKDGTGFKMGMPLLAEEKVEAKVLSHGKEDKIRIFKMKAKKRYSKVQGHRQQFTELEIVSIGGKKAVASAKKVESAEKKATTVAKSVTKAKKDDTARNVKKEVKVAEKKVPAKKVTVKKAETTKKVAKK